MPVHIDPNRRTVLAGLLSLCVPWRSAHARAIDHDDVKGFPDSTSGYLKAFQPYLKVFTGCVPFPAVDAEGNIGAGLKPSGAMDGHCSRSIGQVYVRSEKFRGQCATMYAWYFPKEQNVDGAGNLGHRHGWQNIIVWTEAFDIEARLISISYSSHGYYTREKNPHMHGTHPLVGYQRNPFPLNPSVVDTKIRGGLQPAVSWSDLTPAARQTLDTFDFGKGVPFNEYNWYFNLSKARL
ncbi:NPP1 family protein [Rhizobium brockwellii]|uniref:NPP1 family protein n=1 Tax=Rhizobium brockwellii TaxID=3019932 RepID=UPI003F971C73